MTYTPSEKRYDIMKYNRCGRSGLKLPAISLVLWHNWGKADSLRKQIIALGWQVSDTANGTQVIPLDK